LRSAFARLPTSRRIVPAEADPELIGDLKSPDEETAGERGASPAWLSTVAEAQRTLPSFRAGSVVYCTLRD
ncbi:MAG: alpha/beta hydrolase, partial [Halobaculum sp.]